MAWTEYTYFTIVTLSDDGPFDWLNRFTCRLCAYTFDHQLCGSYNIGAPSPQEIVRTKMRDHLLGWHRDEILSQHRTHDQDT
jgi:hypothetical protein